MPPKTDDDFDYEIDWDDELKALKKGRAVQHYAFKLDADLTCEVTVKMGGERKMTPKERDILERLIDKRVQKVIDEGVKDIQSLLDDLDDDVHDIRRNLSVSRTSAERKVAAEKAFSTANEEIQEVCERANKEILEEIEATVSGYVKGKHHFKKKVKTIVKHSILVPLSIAAIPVGAIFAFSGFGAPVGIVATLGALQNLKSLRDFVLAQRGGINEFAQRIQKNAADLVELSERYIAAAETLEDNPDDEDAKAALSIIKHDINKREFAAIAKDKFLNMHSTSVEHLDELVDDYRKRMNKYRYQTIHLGSKIDKLEDQISKFEDQHKETLTGIALFEKVIGKGGAADLDKELKKSKESLHKVDDILKTLKAKKAEFEAGVADEIDHIEQVEKNFDEWKANLDALKAQRPTAVHQFKKAMKVLVFTKALAEIGLSGGSDGLSKISSAVEVSITVLGGAKDIYGLVSTVWDDVRKQVVKENKE